MKKIILIAAISLISAAPYTFAADTPAPTAATQAPAFKAHVLNRVELDARMKLLRLVVFLCTSAYSPMTWKRSWHLYQKTDASFFFPIMLAALENRLIYSAPRALMSQVQPAFKTTKQKVEH